MKFVRIEMLFLIWTVPVLFLVFLYGIRKRRKIMTRYASARGLQAIAAAAGVKRRWIKAALMLIVLLFVALALSGPQYGYKWQEIERKGIDIMIALDCSRSMLAQDIKPTRLDGAKREVFDLLGLLKGDRVGLVAFAGTAFLQCPLTIDYAAFNLFLSVLEPDFLPVGGTDVAGAVQTALDGFEEDSNSEKAIILITDGESTGSNPEKAAETAAAQGVKLFCIGVGKGEGAPVPDKQGGFKKDRSGNIVLTRLDEDTLSKMAVMTGGTYVRSVAGDMDLDRIYTREIRGKMETAALSSGRKQIWEDRYQWMLFLATIALVAELFWPSARKTTTTFTLLLAMMLSFSTPAHATGIRDLLKNGLEAYEKGDYETARKFFIDAQLEEPERDDIFYNLGNTLYKIGDYDSALKNYYQTLKSDNPDLRQKAQYNLGNASYRQGKLENAMNHYKAALDLDPNDQQAKQNLEFVRKILEQQQKTQNQPQQGDSKNNQKEQDQQKQGSQQQQNQGKQQQNQNNAQSERGTSPPEDTSRPEFGSEMDASPESEPESDSQANASPQDTQEAEKEAQSAPPQPKPGDAEAQKQAQRMLNRLKDKPGRAMIPSYGEQDVEMDW